MTHCSHSLEHRYRRGYRRTDRGGRTHFVECCRECERARKRKESRKARLATRGDRFASWVAREGKPAALARYERRVARQAARAARKIIAARKPRLVRRSPHDMNALIARLISDDPLSSRMPRSAQAYRARYRYEPGFREHEIKRRHQQKTRAPIPEDGSLTPEVMRRMFAAAKRCAYCRRPMKSTDKTLDHVEPKAKGGAHSQLNAIICCRRCNTKKQATPPTQMVLC